jgi:cyanate permease
LGGGQEQGGGTCAQPASRIAPTMWVVILEMLAALALLALIVWWTWPKKPKDDA